MGFVKRLPINRNLVQMKKNFSFFVILFFVILFVYFNFFKGANYGQSFIEKIKIETITLKDIKAIYKLDYNIGIPFTQQEYDGLVKKEISNKKDITDLFNILKTYSIEGHRYRNHPGMISRGILQIRLYNDSLYYIYYELRTYDPDYVVVEANTKGSTNPNSAVEYENIPLADFIKNRL